MTTDRSAALSFAVLLMIPFLVVGVYVHLAIHDAAFTQFEASLATDLGARADVSEAEILTGDDLRAPVSPSRADELDAWARTHVIRPTTYRLNLWAPDGTIVYSTERQLIGTVDGNSSGLRAVVELGSTGGAVVEETIEDGEWMYEGYVAVSVGGEVGVFEIYENVDELTALVDRQQTELDRVLLVSLVVLYVAVLPLVHRALRTIRGQRDDMEAALERSREASEVKDRFLEAISHELRTPLTSVLGPIETLRMRGAQLDAEQTDSMLLLIDRNASKLARLLRDLLDVDRIRRDVHGLERVDTDICALVSGITTDIGMDDRHVTVACEIAQAHVDGGKVERVVENLLANAYRHTPPGTAVHVTVVAADDALVVAVDDAGPGLRPELRETIFDPFERGDSPRHSPGTGVGLSVVQTFARLHGGEARAEASPLGGARFVVTFPGAFPVILREPVGVH